MLLVYNVLVLIGKFLIFEVLNNDLWECFSSVKNIWYVFFLFFLDKLIIIDCYIYIWKEI